MATAPPQPEHWHVIVVGAGIVGALIASRLMKPSRRVLLLDAGKDLAALAPDRTRLVENYVQTIARSPSSPFRAEADPAYEDSEATTFYSHEHAVSPFRSTYERAVGGTTWHWYGLTPRMVPTDFRMRSEYGVGVDWPIGYADLEPWYCEAEAELGVAGNHDEMQGVLGAWRSKPYPMPAVWSAYADEIVRERLGGFTYDGAPVPMVHTPQARNSRPYQGRPACAGNSSCIPLCPIGAKYDASVHVQIFRETGGEVRAEHAVTRVLVEEGGKVAGLEVRSPDGSTAKYTADQYVLATHGIETPRLLLRSQLCAGNEHVGAYLMDHLNRATWVRTPFPTYAFRGPPTVSGIEALRDGAFRRLRAGFRVSLGNDGAGRTYDNSAIMSDARPRLGAALRAYVEDAAQHLYRASCLVEMLPYLENRVRLGAEADALGAKPHIAFSLGEYERRGLEEGDRFLSAFLARVAPDADQHPQTSRLYDGAGHIMGTTRMGTGAHDSVVDQYGAVHGHAGLYIAGCSVFPTGGTSNPTLTAAALALRLASHFEDRWFS
jgi:choline dehydrogenase-like flavoprotein